jgi:GNAT superfamily N-acetyltransferase
MSFQERSAVPSDYATYLRLSPELGADDPVPSVASWTQEMCPGTLILEDQGAPIGYSWSRSLGDIGYVFHVVVDPKHRGQGAGRTIMLGVARRLRGLGCSRWTLNVRINNEPAIRLYERLGFKTKFRSNAFRLQWSDVENLPREATRLESRIFDASEDDALEDAFGHPRGRFKDLRDRGRITIRLVDPAHPEEPKVGIAIFSPQFPGSFPFSVARPTLAIQMLEAMRAHKLPEHDYVRLIVENDDTLSAQLRAAGARTLLELFRMEGSLDGV